MRIRIRIRIAYCCVWRSCGKEFQTMGDDGAVHSKCIAQWNLNKQMTTEKLLGGKLFGGLAGPVLPLCTDQTCWPATRRGNEGTELTISSEVACWESTGNDRWNQSTKLCNVFNVQLSDNFATNSHGTMDRAKPSSRSSWQSRFLYCPCASRQSKWVWKHKQWYGMV